MKQILSLLCSVLMLCTMLPVIGCAEEQPVSVLLIETNTGCILSAEHEELPRPIGSLSKLMTAYLAARAIDEGRFTPDTLLTAGESVREVTGASIWLEPGDTVTVSDLLLGLLVGNANDAAAVLADSISGDAAHFVMDMNAAAFDLGMRSTRFASPQGYDDPEAYSTAKDLSRLVCAVLKCDVLTPALTTWRTVIREDGTPAELVSENTFTRTRDGCRGLKAAHSEAAGYCLTAAETHGDMTCAAIVLGASDTDARFTAAAQLLREGFSGYHLTTPGFAEEFLRPLRLRKGTESAVLLELASLPMLAVPSSAQTEAVLVLPEYWEAPVRKGQKVGEVHFYHSDTCLYSAPLLAAEEVHRMAFSDAWRRILHTLFS